jgi:ribosome-associated protein
MDLREISEDLEALLANAVRALDDKKAGDLKILHVGQLSSITDYLILASGNSEPHLKALLNAVSRELKDMHVSVIGSDAGQGSGWAVIDAFDVMIHLFLPDQRDFYKLDQLWKDAESIDPQALLKVAAGGSQ